MPFDGIGFAFDERVSTMNQVIQLLATPDQWCKGTLKTYNGHRYIRGAMIDVAEAHCLAPIILRAIREVTGNTIFRSKPSTIIHIRTTLRYCACSRGLGTI